MNWGLAEVLFASCICICMAVRSGTLITQPCELVGIEAGPGDVQLGTRILYTVYLSCV